MIPDSKTARAAGLLFFIPFLTYGVGSSIITAIADSPAFPANLPAGRVVTAVLLMLVNSICVAGIGAVLFPVLRKRNQFVAAAYLSARMMEAVLLAAGLVALLLLLPVSEAGTADAAFAQRAAVLAVKANYFAYQLAMTILGLGSLLFCGFLYQTRLIPRYAAIWGAGGYLLLLTGAVLEVYGLKAGVLLAVPGGLFELFLAGRLVFKGFDQPRSALPAVS